MTADWALGTGSANRTFGQGSIEVVDMMDAPGVNAARDAFYQKSPARLQMVTTAAFSHYRTLQRSLGLSIFSPPVHPLSNSSVVTA
jgi:hypothetical protein